MVLAGFFVGSLLLLVAFICFDKLLKFQYSEDRAQWYEYGKPSGFFWSAPGSPFFSGSVQRTVRLLAWTFRSGEWMTSETGMLRAVWVMRICVFAFWLFWLIVTINF